MKLSYLVAAFAGVIGAQMVMDTFRIGFDDSDNADTGQRSGLRIYRDNLTGCEYVAPMFGGATPRLGYNGEQICRDGKGKPFGDDDVAADPAGNGWVRTQSSSSQSNSNSSVGSLLASGSSGGNAAGGSANADNRPEYHLPWTKQPDGTLACEDNAAHRKEHGIPQGGSVQVWCGPDEEAP